MPSSGDGPGGERQGAHHRGPDHARRTLRGLSPRPPLERPLMPPRGRTLIAAGSAPAALPVLCTFSNGPIDAAPPGCGAAAPAASPPAGGYTRPWAAAAPAEE